MTAWMSRQQSIGFQHDWVSSVLECFFFYPTTRTAACMDAPRSELALRHTHFLSPLSTNITYTAEHTNQIIFCFSRASSRPIFSVDGIRATVAQNRGQGVHSSSVPT
jgi:hypothetical protein